MKKVYVVIKLAKELTGEFASATTEGAFSTATGAQNWMAGKPVVWEEIINGVSCYCERAFFETEIMDI